MNLGKPLSRRHLLLGAGASVALPFLEAMSPRSSVARASVVAPRRWVLWHFPTGYRRDTWVVDGPGEGEKDWKLTPSLEPLGELGLKGDVSVIQGTGSTYYARSQGASHTCGVSAQLTGFNCTPELSVNRRTIDQDIADSIGRDTPIRSLQLGTRILHENPNDEPGYSSVLKDHLSWKDDATPLPKQVDPAQVFKRLFGDIVTDDALSAAEEARSQRLRRSVLDTVLTDARSLSSYLGSRDRQKLEQYLDNVREVEASIQAAPRNDSSGMCSAQERVASFHAPDDIEDHVRQMNQLMLLALQCDATRVIVFQYENTVTPIRHPFLGVNAPYHLGVTHHSSDLEKLRDYATVNRWLVSQYGEFVKSLKESEDVDGESLLHNCSVVMTSELGDGNSHDHGDLPCLLAGRAGGALQSGRHLWRAGADFMQVLIGTAQAVGAKIDSFGVDYRGKQDAPIDGPLPGLLD